MSKKQRSKKSNKGFKSKALRKKEKAMVEKSLQLLNSHAMTFRKLNELKEHNSKPVASEASENPQPVQCVHIEAFPEELFDEVTSAFQSLS